ncbi:hypothetical protein PC129_g14447 [Phytophthora cactorum]|uniref:Uncharacterized protein n=1 Tax=Phytophthora cactorum TaxID=29920 RepID=A0A8T1KJT9_9STRA|nr:hypothetical protein PC111_g18521 [Phytophthora cactorum]KAG2851117.1 hypothetical protein PC113_g16181 [Phytophthora cactorum]KAG2889857.1 hypothetical protein PC114_g17757 [Phytophthora cactorum]KAG2917713.1 hypothetical protein PC117_g17338 [Phytophthora cactorum]KAG3015520.1 hypothetical protein PC119_g11753 [Phytophthora cactorum]
MCQIVCCSTNNSDSNLWVGYSVLPVNTTSHFAAHASGHTRAACAQVEGRSRLYLATSDHGRRSDEYAAPTSASLPSEHHVRGAVDAVP